MIVDHIIFEKFYGEAERRGIVWTLMGWAIKQGLFTQEEIERDDHAYCEWADRFEHADAVKTVLAYEIAYFIFRRLNGTWGEMVDFFHYGCNSFCNRYREETGYQVIGNNPELLD